MYEIIEPVIEEHEVFDSSMLKETINSLIASGKRNFAIDMSPLDYIYSDTINMLMALNKRVLDVTGRLSLMAPQPEVIQILKRAGIHNILRIFETEAELIKSSEDMILQTTSIKMSDVNAALQQAPPQSEFDQLRSEIGSVFGTAEPSGQTSRQQPSAAATPQGRSGNVDEFDQMFQQFDGSPQISNRGPVQPPSMQPPPAPQPQSPRFQPRQFVQPPVQPIPLRPAAPVNPRQPVEIPKFNTDFSTVRSETQRFTTAPGAPSYHEQHYQPSAQQEKFAVPEEDTFETAAPVKQEKKPRIRDSFDSFDEEDEHDDEFKKKSSLPILVLVLLILALGGAGAFIVYKTMGKKKAAPVASVTPPPQSVAPVTPQIPVETPKVEPTETEVQEPDKAEVEPEKEIVESKPQPKPPVKRAVSRPATRRSSSPPRPSVEKASSTASSTKNEVVITSFPSGASVTINGQQMGITPYTWSQPFFGKVNVQLSKSGYKDAVKSFEFTGGSMRESISMEKEIEAPPPPEKKPVQKEEPRPVVQSTPKRTPPPPPSRDEMDDPFSDIGADDDFSLEPETEEPEPAAPSKPPTPEASAAYTPSSRGGGGGGEAQIFIASIPPVADVYLGGQLIGKTNVSELKIPAGMQTLKFVKGGKEITKQLNLQPGKNPSQMVRIP